MTNEGRLSVEGAPAAEAREALRRVVTSAAFRPAPQLASFLTYIVETTLAGRQSEIKGYTIAVEALGRHADFDPVSDPIVRVEAGRLRRALDQYYAGEGANDPLRIVVSRGGYVPTFERIDGLAPAASGVAPRNIETEHAPAADAQPAGALVAAAPSRRPLRTAAVAALFAIAALGVAMLALRMTRPPGPPPFDLAHTSAPAVLPVVRIDALRANDPKVDEVSRRFSEHLSEALARFDEFVVIDSLAATVAGGRDLKPAYIIEHRGQLAEGTIVATMRLIEAGTGRVVWSTGADASMAFASDAREIRETVRRLAVRIAQPYGVLHADLREHSPPGHPTRCIVRAYDYWIAPSEPLHARVRECLEQITRANQGFHPAWSLLAMITLDEHRIGYNMRPDALPRAIAAAQRAVQLAPESARAQQALMAVLTVSGEIDEALKTGFDAVRRNPYDTDILADVGARLTQAGRGREGRPLLERAADLNQARPPWHEFYRFLAARQASDMAAAKALARFMQGSEAPLALLGSIVAGMDAGRPQDAARALRQLREVSPTFAENPGKFLDRSFFAPEVRRDILGAIEQASLVVAGR